MTISSFGFTSSTVNFTQDLPASDWLTAILAQFLASRALPLVANTTVALNVEVELVWFKLPPLMVHVGDVQFQAGVLVEFTDTKVPVPLSTSLTETVPVCGPVVVMVMWQFETKPIPVATALTGYLCHEAGSHVFVTWIVLSSFVNGTQDFCPTWPAYFGVAQFLLSVIAPEFGNTTFTSMIVTSLTGFSVLPGKVQFIGAGAVAVTGAQAHGSLVDEPV